MGSELIVLPPITDDGDGEVEEEEVVAALAVLLLLFVDEIGGNEDGVRLVSVDCC